VGVLGLLGRRRGWEVVDVRDPGRMGTRADEDVVGDAGGTGNGSCSGAIGAAGEEMVRVGVRAGIAAGVAPLRVAGAYCVGIGLG
jgi:hypothetical protein